MSTISKLKYYTNLIFKTEVIDKVNYLLDRTSSSVVVVSSPEQLSGELSSDKVYKLDGIIDFTGTGYNITIPPNGLNIKGDTFDISGLVCEDDNYSLFVTDLDGGVNYDIIIAAHVGIIANFSGVRDVAIISISETKTLSKGDRVRLEVSNITDTTNVTVEVGSHLTILAL